MTSHPTANPKADHYRASLSQALLRGAWAESSPGTAPNGTELGWGELVRKWGKHTGGNTALIHHLRDISLLYLSTTSHLAASGFIAVPPASGPESGSSTSSTDAPSTETATSESASSFVHIPHPNLHRKKPSVGSGSVTSAGGVVASSSSDGTVRGARAAYLSPGDLDGDDGNEGEGEWSIGVGSERAEEVREGFKGVERILAGSKLRPDEVKSAKLILAYHLHALGKHEEVLKLYSGCDWGEPRQGVVEGDAAILERIRGRCRQGMSYELSSNPTQAIKAYLATVPLISAMTTFPIPTAPYLLANPSQTPKLPFDSHRELHRNIATALARAAILSAKQSNSLSQTLRILRTYHALSYAWPSSFRPLQRQQMLLLYLRGLLAAYPPAGVPSDAPYLLTGATSTLVARATWRAEVAEAISLGQQLLTTTTSFPKAGSVNTPVTAFAELVVALHDKSTLIAREAIATLWWAMTLTFQSQSILRSLTRLLANSGDSAMAKRTFELYVQLVLKSRETQQPEVSLQLKRRPTEDVPAGPEEIQRQAEEAANDITGDDIAEVRKTQTAEAEIDGDEVFVEALLVGARLLVKDVGEVEEGWRYVCLAGDVVTSAYQRGRGLSEQLRARMEECKGIVRMAMASKGADSISRPTYQAQAINHLKAATSLDPSSISAFYHLAYCQAEARQISAAIESIRTTLELDSRNVQAWHLLALLLTAQGDWTGATTAGEAGVGIWESEEEAEGASGVSNLDPTVESKDFAVQTPVPTSSIQTSPILTSHGLRPVLPTPTRLPTTKAKRLEQVIQLRMTLNVIAEKTQGPELAMLKQQELFAFFSARSGKNDVNGNGRNSATPSMVGSVRDKPANELGDSYVAINETARGPSGLGESMVTVHPPPPHLGASIGEPNIPTIVAPENGMVETVSPADSNTASETEEADKGTGRKTLGGGKKLIPRHLHVPGRAGSLRRGAASNVSLNRYRTVSTSSTALSVAPTAIHSHYQGQSKAPSIAPPPIPPIKPEHTPAEARILSNLWLMSSATFRRWSKPDQCLVSISEAETLDPENPDVWVQLGLYHVSVNSFDEALKSFTKSLLLLPDYPPAVVSLAKLYLSRGNVELAHSLLNQLTQDRGWDSAEAWSYLGRVCEAQGGRSGRVRECLEYALGLEESRGCRRFGEGVERWL